MIFHQALKLIEEIKQLRQELTYLANLNGVNDSNAIAFGQNLDQKIAELQKLILKVNQIESRQLYKKSTVFKMNLRGGCYAS